MTGDALVLELDGQQVRVSSPDKVVVEATGATKLDLIRYYEAVGAPVRRDLGGRPVLLQRYPKGARLVVLAAAHPRHRSALAADHHGGDCRRDCYACRSRAISG